MPYFWSEAGPTTVVVMVPGTAAVPAVVTTVVTTLPTVLVVVLAVVAPVATTELVVVVVPRDKPNLLIN